MLVAYRYKNRNGSMNYRYACFANRRGNKCSQHSVNAPDLDGPIWKLCSELVMQPEVIEDRLREHSEDSAVQQEAETLELALQEVERRQQNIARRLALLDDDVAAAPLVEELSALGNRRRQLDAARKEVATRAERAAVAARDAIHRRDWLASLAMRLDNAPYEVRRDVLRALGVRVKLYPNGHAPRWEMEWSPVWDDPSEQLLFNTSRGSLVVGGPN
jgi:hypothetical protein